jgi:hypothetical protein
LPQRKLGLPQQIHQYFSPLHTETMNALSTVNPTCKAFQVCCTPTTQQLKPTVITIGDRIPNFTLPNFKGQQIKIWQQQSKTVEFLIDKNLEITRFFGLIQLITPAFASILSLFLQSRSSSCRQHI